MKISILLSLLLVAPAVTHAQTKPAAKPSTTKATTTRTAAASPGTRTTTTKTTATVRPATPPAPAKPVAPPAPAPAPAPAPTAATTSDSPFGVGTGVLNLGIGVGNRYAYGVGFFGGSSSVSPAFSVSYERGIQVLGPGVLGVGGFVGYQGASIDLGGGDKWRYNDIIVTVRGTFHYPVAPQFDAYGGIGLGVRHLGVSITGSNSIYDPTGVTELAAGLFVGGRYFFTPQFGGFAELGYDQTFLKIGLSAKF